MHHQHKTSLLLIVFVQSEIQSQHKGQDGDDEQYDEEAPPLHLSRAPRARNALVQMHVSGFGVLFYVFRVLLCLLDHRLLDHDCFGQVLEELVKLDQGALDLLDVIVARADGTEDGRGGGCAVGFELGRVSISGKFDR